MTTRLSADRLSTLRTAADVGIRMAGLQPHTVHVQPDELAAMVVEIIERRAAPDAADVTVLAAERQELLNEIAVLRRHLADREKQLQALRASRSRVRQ